MGRESEEGSEREEKKKKKERWAPMPESTDLVWHCYLPDILPEQIYGYRVYGPMSRKRASLQSAQGRARSLRKGACARNQVVG